MSVKPKTVIERFWRRVELTPGCWLWQGYRSPGGYGYIGEGGRKGKLVLVHRVAYEAFIGPIPAGLDIDHLCRVRHCVNPLHLEPVSRRENLLRGETLAAGYAAREACKAGHLYTPENTRLTPKGARICRRCHSLNERARQKMKGLEL